MASDVTEHEGRSFVHGYGGRADALTVDEGAITRPVVHDGDPALSGDANRGVPTRDRTVLDMHVAVIVSTNRDLTNFWKRVFLDRTVSQYDQHE
jgi:hypothetical protein